MTVRQEAELATQRDAAAVFIETNDTSGTYAEGVYHALEWALGNFASAPMEGR